MYCVNSLSNIFSRFNKGWVLLLKSSKELTSIVRSGNLRKREYPYVTVYRDGATFAILPNYNWASQTND